MMASSERLSQHVPTQEFLDVPSITRTSRNSDPNNPLRRRANRCQKWHWLAALARGEDEASFKSLRLHPSTRSNELLLSFYTTMKPFASHATRIKTSVLRLMA